MEAILDCRLAFPLARTNPIGHGAWQSFRRGLQVERTAIGMDCKHVPGHGAVSGACASGSATGRLPMGVPGQWKPIPLPARMSRMVNPDETCSKWYDMSSLRQLPAGFAHYACPGLGIRHEACGFQGRAASTAQWSSSRSASKRVSFVHSQMEKIACRGRQHESGGDTHIGAS